MSTHLTAQELFERGYVGRSNKYQMVGRIDRPDWVDVLAKHYRRAAADFVVMKEGSGHDPSVGWAEHYISIFSKDQLEGIGKEKYEQLKNLNSQHYGHFATYKEINMDKTPHSPGHVHAELMAQYAEDAKMTERPWESWEMRIYSKEWSALTGNPVWSPDAEYRRKPRTIRIGNYDVPEPCREPLAKGQKFWLVNIGGTTGAGLLWRSEDSCQPWLRRSLVHLTKEAAELHARALIELSGGQV